MSEKITTMGYNDEGKAQMFELGKGEKLPKGWHDAPVRPEHHPNNPNFGKAPAATPDPEPPAEKPRRGHR